VQFRKRVINVPNRGALPSNFREGKKNCYKVPASTLNNANLCQRVLEKLCNSKRISSRAHSRLVAQFNDVMTEMEIE
jgi:hypothetical protein